MTGRARRPHRAGAGNGNGKIGRTGTGTPAERRVMKLLHADGYVVTRSAGSLGPGDLMAAKLGQVLLIQVKNCPWDSPGAHREEWFNGLWTEARKAGGLPVIVDWAVPPGVTGKGKPRTRAVIRWQVITGPHLPRSHDYPRLVAPFTTDEVGRPAVDTRREVTLTCPVCQAQVSGRISA